MNCIIEENNQILEKIINENKLKLNQSIDYVYFLELYKPYENKMSEKDFAKILGINYTSYSNLKNTRKQSKNIKK